jgi:hypothetical protein
LAPPPANTTTTEGLAGKGAGDTASAVCPQHTALIKHPTNVKKAGIGLRRLAKWVKNGFMAVAF